MVSEDSQYLGWFAVIHRLSDLRDLHDSRNREMSAALHQLDDPYELLEVVPLRSSKWVFLEERNDPRPEVIVSLHAITEEIFLVIVVPSVSIDLPATEETNQIIEDVTA